MAFATHCPECGYDLRGTNSAVCPECGNDDLSPLITRSNDGFGFVTGAAVDTCHACRTPLSPDAMVCETCGAARRAWLEVTDKETLHRLRALLDHHGFLLETSAMGQSLAGLADVYGFRSPGMSRLWVEAARFDDIEALLESHGISIASPGRPIVDRAEPTCPFCQADLDADGEAVCPSCGESFEWVEIGSSEDEDASDDLTDTNDDGFRLVGIALDAVAATIGLTIIILVGQRIYSAVIFFGVILAFLAAVRLPVWLRYARSGGSGPEPPDA